MSKILITGGTGSFGSTMVKKLINHDEFDEIRIFSRDEKKQEDMRLKLQHNKLNFFLGDVRDYDSINRAVMGCDYIFHAAALKQVPSCEFNPMEAIRTNIIGANNVLESALVNGVKSTVVLSTDKAVYPINTMGLTKALMEKLAISKSRDFRCKTGLNKFNATRYGNVMASRGSIIPLFIQQIKSGSPLTITNPNMTRFMMSLEDSVDLVLYAFKHGDNGDTLIQKAPSCSVEQLARVLKSMFNASNEIKHIGIRHGEKMYETLCSKEEMSVAIDDGDYFRIPADLRNLDYSKFIDPEKKEPKIEEFNSDNCYRLSDKELEQLLLTLPEVYHEL